MELQPELCCHQRRRVIFPSSKCRAQGASLSAQPVVFTLNVEPFVFVPLFEHTKPALSPPNPFRPDEDGSEDSAGGVLGSLHVCQQGYMLHVIFNKAACEETQLQR